MKNNRIIKHRIIFILVMLFTPLFANAMVAQADSLVLDDANNAFLQLRGHVLKGIELDNGKQLRAALSEFKKGIKICEEMNLYERYADKGRHWIYLFTMPAYTLAATVSDRLGEAEQAVLYCNNAIGWIEHCDSVKIREPHALQVCLTMLKYRRLNTVHTLAVRTYDDACKLGKHDDALLLATLLMETEDTKFNVSPADNPWIVKGREHYNHAKLVEAKSLYLTFLRKAYIKANMIDKAQQMERQLRAAMGKSTRMTEYGDIVPLDTSSFSKVLPTLESETFPEAKKDSLSVKNDSLSANNDSLTVKNDEANGISEKVRYIYRQHYGWVIFTASVLLIVILVFIAYATRQRYIRRRTQQEAEQEQNRRYLEGMESERTRLAKELHDGVSNQLLAIEMKLNDNHDPNPDQDDNADENAKWEQARRMLTESREQVRRVSHELMPPEFSFAHLGEVIENFMDEMDGTNGIAMHFDSGAKEECYKSIPEADALEIYRIIQEAVTNAVKHSGASDIYVLIKDEEEQMEIRITDNGTTPQKAVTGGIGHRTMMQRAETIGAELSIGRTAYATVVTLQYVKKK